MSNSHLIPPQPIYVNPDHIIPLSPPPRPPFQHYSSSSTLPPTPRTSFPSDRLESTRPLSTFTPCPTSHSYLPPYLTLLPRLLLTTLSPALLPLILTIGHLIQTQQSTSQLASSLRSDLLSACQGIAKGAAGIQSLPRYLAMQTNENVIRMTQASVLALGEGLIDLVIIMEEVLNFIVDCYRSVLLCTIQLAVQGTLDILIAAVQTITSSVTSSLETIRSDIQSAITSGNVLIQKAVSSINSVTNLVDVTLSVPNITVPALSYLENVTIPTTFEDTLLKLNASMPDLAELRTKMNSIIDTPFDLLISEINSTRLSIASNLNSSILPVPTLSQLSALDSTSLENQLCGNLNTGLIDGTASALHTLGSVAIGLMFLVLAIVWGVLAWWEWRRWRSLEKRVELVKNEMKEGDRDPWLIVALVEHPMLERYGEPVINRLARTPRARRNLRWYFSYLSHPTCLTLLFISAIGFISLEFQLVALKSMKHHLASSANSTITASTDSMVSYFNSLSANTSQSYALEFNAKILEVQDSINNDLFGNWVNTTAVTLNSTLVEFYAEVENLLNASFGGTILYNPINTFVYCLVGSKITNLEKGLTWLSNHSQISLPMVPVDILQLSNSSMKELATPIVAAAVGSGSGSRDNGDGGVVNDLISHWENALKVERTVYAILLALWLTLALIGLGIAIWHTGGREKYLAFRSRNQGDGDNSLVQDLPPSDSQTQPIRPWLFRGFSKPQPHPIYDTYTEKQEIPTIIEPKENLTSSFFDYRRGSKSGSNSRAGQTLSFLAAPGQAFLRMTGYNSNAGESVNGDKSRTGTPFFRPGMSSDKYDDNTRVSGEVDRSVAPTPPPFWVTKFYGAVDGFKEIVSRNQSRQNAQKNIDIMDTGNQPNGPAAGRGMSGGTFGVFGGLRRNISVKTDQSFGASRVPTARTPREDWPESREEVVPCEDEQDGGYDEFQSHHWHQEEGFSGRLTLGGKQHECGMIGDGRYPDFSHVRATSQSICTEGSSRKMSNLNPTTVTERVSGERAVETYPRRMSRAPTVYEKGAHEIPPNLPAKDNFSSGETLTENIFSQVETDHFSQPQSQSHCQLPPLRLDTSRPSNLSIGNNDNYASPSHDPAEHDGDGPERMISPSSSVGSIVWSEPRVESARTGTAALASILANLNAQRSAGARRVGERDRFEGDSVRGKENGHGLDPFVTPFDGEVDHDQVF